MQRDAARSAYPGFPFLWADEPAGVEALLRSRGWLAADETLVDVAPAGAGNMNLTLRVATSRRKLVVKQARPWVEKYPAIAAPWERATFERRFYEQVQSLPDVAGRMPGLLGADQAAAVVLLEYCADASDLTTLYAGDRLTAAELTTLGEYLAALHRGTQGVSAGAWANQAMRDLNYLHLFVVPLDEQNGLDLAALDPELPAAARELRADEAYCRTAAEVGQRYLAAGNCLVHGDYFPGSWLRTAAGIRIIDPEFGFAGPTEWDLGCAWANFELAQQPAETFPALLTCYRQALASSETRLPTDFGWIARFAGIEIMRRIIGVAQLPLPAQPGLRPRLLARSRELLLSPPEAPKP